MTCKVITGFGDFITNLVYSPNGKYLVSGGFDSKLNLIWNIANWKSKIFTISDDTIISLIFSLDGRYLISGCGNNIIEIRDTETWECIQKLEGHLNWVKSLACSPDGKYLVSGSNDKTVRVWNLEAIPFNIAPLFTLKKLIAHGLDQTGEWNCFLQQELYDPRIFYLIQEFAECEKK